MNYRIAFLLLALTAFFASCNDASENSGCDAVDCGGHGICVEDQGSPQCSCDEGYAPDGLDCVKNECDDFTCLHGVCVMTGGEPSCQCDPGYAGETCNVCARGYKTDGLECVSGSPCDEDPCVHGVCSSDGGKVLCVCHTGYAGEVCDRCAEGYVEENLQCVPDNECYPNPCGDNGVCIVQNSEPVCICDTGYTGDTCGECSEGYEKDGLSCVPEDGIIDPENPCIPNPCDEENRSICVVVGDNYVCDCDEGYFDDDGVCVPTGDNSCIPNPCTQPNMSECIEDGDSYICECAVGFVGDKCDVRNGELKVTYYDPTRLIENLYIAGEFNGWGESDRMTDEGNGNFSVVLDLDSGDYAYKFFNKDTSNWFLDPKNPYTKYVSDVRNSRLLVEDARHPLLQLYQQPLVAGSSIAFSVGFIRGTSEELLDPATVEITRNGQSVTPAFDSETNTWSVSDSGLDKGKYSYLFKAKDQAGRSAESLFVPVWVEDEHFDWRDGVMYFAMTDRFSDGNAANNSPTSDVDNRANWQGGDFAGLLDALQDNYFNDLGVNVIWLSSISQNTPNWGAGTSDGRKYSGYHSYWPISSGWTDENPLPGVEAVDPHFGDLNDFKAVVDEAHKRGIRIIVDMVANHVHSEHPWWSQHQDDGWFHTPTYVCGWDKPISCWFTDYLPDFEYKNLDLLDAMTDHAIWLAQETNIDGFRMDAVKHMIHDMGWTLRARLSEKIDTTDDIRFYMVGETFVGENEAGTIKEYIGENELDGQFDFPVYWNTKDCFLNMGRDFNSVAGFMAANENFYTDFAILSNFMGNHDVTRALSEADGNVGSAWDNPPGTPSYDEPYKRMRLAWSFLFTIKGIPLIYYGDEYGLPGSGDPDNRRMMIWENQMNSYQKATLQHVQKLGQIREDNIALRRGDRIQITNDANFWAYGFSYEGNKVLVVLNRNGQEVTRNVNVGALGISDGTLSELLRSGSAAVSGGSVSVSVPAKDASIYKLD